MTNPLGLLTDLLGNVLGSLLFPDDGMCKMQVANLSSPKGMADDGTSACPNRAGARKLTVRNQMGVAEVRAPICDAHYDLLKATMPPDSLTP